jgi:hypothetical protein
LCRKATVMSHLTRTISFVSCILSAPSFIFTSFRSDVRRQDVRQLEGFCSDFLCKSLTDVFLIHAPCSTETQ